MLDQCTWCCCVPMQTGMPCAALPPMQREPLRLRNNWAVACVFFAMWDALLVALVWWAIKRFGGPELKHWRVSPSGLV